MLQPQVEKFIKNQAAKQPIIYNNIIIQEYREQMQQNIIESNKYPTEYAKFVTFSDYKLDEIGPMSQFRIYTPETIKTDKTLVLFAGSGFVYSNLDWHDATNRAIAFKTGCKIIVITGRVSPEYKFPTTFLDVYRALQWIIQHARDFNIDSRFIGIGGLSSSANFAALAALKARDENLPLAFQVLMSPCLDLSCQSPLYQTFSSGYLLDKDLIDWLIQQHLPNNIDRTDSQVSPFFAPNLRGLPPTIITVAECEGMRDECLLYAAKLSAYGVKTTTFCAPGQIHEYLGCYRNILIDPNHDPVDCIAEFILAL